MFKTTVKGFASADQRLKNIGIAVGGAEATKVVFAGAQYIRNEAQRRAPVGQSTKHPGRFRSAHLVIPFPVKTDRPAGAIVLVNYKPSRGPTAPYGHIVEKGSKAHVIKRKSGKALSLFGGKIVVESVHHPGAHGRHTFGDAVSSSRARAKQLVQEGLVALINRRAIT